MAKESKFFRGLEKVSRASAQIAWPLAYAALFPFAAFEHKSPENVIFASTALGCTAIGILSGVTFFIAQSRLPDKLPWRMGNSN